MRECLFGCLLFGYISLFCGCDKITEQDFFKTTLAVVEQPYVKDVVLEEAFRTSSTIQMSHIVDSLFISIDRTGQEYLYCISDINTDQVIGVFGRRGRSSNEMFDCLPILDTYRNKDGELCSDVLSFGDGRVFVWNISESIRTESDCYERIAHLYNDDGRYPFLSLYHLNDSSVIVKNSGQSPSEERMTNAPVYEVYSLGTGKLLRQFDLFDVVDVETENPLYTSKSFSGNFDCIKPDRSKMAFGMGYMPVYGILELTSGAFQCYRIDGLQRFSTEERNLHFCNLVSDDQYIYALYYGYDISDPYSERKASTLFVIDWDGRLVSKWMLDQYFTELAIDDDVLYLINKNGVIYSVNPEI